MKTTWLILLLLAGLIGGGTHLALRGRPETGDVYGHKAPAFSPSQVAADGVIEGAQPEIALRPEVAGTIDAIFHRENEEVSKGTVLVELINQTQKQHVSLAEAEVAVARGGLDFVRNGERQERRKALAALENAKRAAYQQAKADYERSQKLGATAVTAEKRESDYYLMMRTQAELDQITAERALVEAPPRPDELAMAEGYLAAAEARLRHAQAELAKTRLTAPIDGRVLRVYSEPGELASPASVQPILLMADLSKRRIRAFVEELDASRVKVGQTAVVVVDGLPDREFTGKIGVVLPRMGKRSLHTDAPEEYKDLYYREVLIDVAVDEALTPNLRVKTRIKVE